MFSVEWRKTAAESLRKIDRTARVEIVNAVEGLAKWPDCKNVKRLRNHKYPYRLRVGRYRVFISTETAIRIIFIEEVKKRDERTY